MFTIILQHAGMIAISAFVGFWIGFGAMALIAMSGRSSREEEQRPWPVEVKR